MSYVVDYSFRFDYFDYPGKKHLIPSYSRFSGRFFELEMKSVEDMAERVTYVGEAITVALLNI